MQQESYLDNYAILNTSIGNQCRIHLRLGLGIITTNPTYSNIIEPKTFQYWILQLIFEFQLSKGYVRSVLIKVY